MSVKGVLKGAEQKCQQNVFLKEYNRNVHKNVILLEYNKGVFKKVSQKCTTSSTNVHKNFF